MPIVNSVIWKQRNRGNRRLAVFEQHTDHNGDIHEHRYSCPVDHDIDQALLDWVHVLEAGLIDNEKESIQRQVEEGADPATITRKHITTEQKAKRVIKALKAGKAENVIKAAQFVDGFNDAQILNFFTSSQLIEIRERIADIKNNVVLINRLKSQRGEL